MNKLESEPEESSHIMVDCFTIKIVHLNEDWDVDLSFTKWKNGGKSIAGYAM